MHPESFRARTRMVEVESEQVRQTCVTSPYQPCVLELQFLAQGGSYLYHCT